jgi:tRNA(Ile)-lysidine synthase
MTNTKSLAIQQCIVREDTSYLYSAASARQLRCLLISPKGVALATGNWVLATGLLYHFSVHELAERLLKTIRKQGLIKAGDRVAAAVSGGADSMALLLLLLELRAEFGIVLCVAHVNHELRGEESDADERFVAEFAKTHSLELHVHKAPLNRQPDSGIEAAARKLRYDFFRQLARDGRVSKIATAHTLDDQAETVLLRVLRGTGIRGLSGIHPRIVFQGGGHAFGEIVRPLLGFRRAELEAFLRDQDQEWREDSSNRDLTLLRNRVRHRVLPLLKENFGSATAENLADLAEIARAEEEHWTLAHAEIRVLVRDSGDKEEKGSLALSMLSTLPVAAQRRLIRGWLDTNVHDLSVKFGLIEEMRDLANGPAGKKLELPGGHFVRRTQRDLCLEPTLRGEVSNYEYRLPVPGAVEVRELGIRLEALLVERESVPQDERERLLDHHRLPSELVVRNWRAGDRYWPAHTKEAKKIKELLNDRHIVGAAKGNWPVAVADGCGLVWMRGFSTPAEFDPEPGVSRVLWIRVIAS